MISSLDFKFDSTYPDRTFSSIDRGPLRFSSGIRRATLLALGIVAVGREARSALITALCRSAALSSSMSANPHIGQTPAFIVLEHPGQAVIAIDWLSDERFMSNQTHIRVEPTDELVAHPKLIPHSEGPH